MEEGEGRSVSGWRLQAGPGQRQAEQGGGLACRGPASRQTAITPTAPRQPHPTPIPTSTPTRWQPASTHLLQRILLAAAGVLVAHGAAHSIAQVDLRRAARGGRAGAGAGKGEARGQEKLGAWVGGGRARGMAAQGGEGSGSRRRRRCPTRTPMHPPPSTHPHRRTHPLGRRPADRHRQPTHTACTACTAQPTCPSTMLSQVGQLLSSKSGMYTLAPLRGGRYRLKVKANVKRREQRDVRRAARHAEQQLPAHGDSPPSPPPPPTHTHTYTHVLHPPAAPVERVDDHLAVGGPRDLHPPVLEVGGERRHAPVALAHLLRVCGEGLGGAGRRWGGEARQGWQGGGCFQAGGSPPGRHTRRLAHAHRRRLHHPRSPAPPPPPPAAARPYARDWSRAGSQACPPRRTGLAAGAAAPGVRSRCRAGQNRAGQDGAGRGRDWVGQGRQGRGVGSRKEGQGRSGGCGRRDSGMGPGKRAQVECTKQEPAGALAREAGEGGGGRWRAARSPRAVLAGEAGQEREGVPAGAGSGRGAGCGAG